MIAGRTAWGSGVLRYRLLGTLLPVEGSVHLFRGIGQPERDHDLLVLSESVHAVELVFRPVAAGPEEGETLALLQRVEVLDNDVVES